jgi:site-specific DNA-methyltransferase (adenine-specific)
MRKQTKLLLGDNIESLSKLPDNSIDSIVTDPPYGLKFMGKKWDYNVPTKEFWAEAFRVLKPGGHVLSFGGTRTYHRMVVNLEDGGFEIRDCISWLYGSGFPKSLNIGKAVDKIQGNERESIGIKDNVMINITKGTSPYEGQFTALKPAQELICMARKPISEKTIAENVMKWGTGGLDIDGSRVESNEELGRNNKTNPFDNNVDNGGIWNRGSENIKPLDTRGQVEGRFPANIILDEEAGKMLDEQSGVTVTKADPNYKHNKTDSGSEIFNGRGTYTPRQDSGGASRFFYSAKVSKKERNMGLDGFEEKDNKKIVFPENEYIGSDGSVRSNKHTTAKNNHTTLKPITLMSYLINLVTPKNGIVLDPFMGSGSTGIAALLNDYRFCGMEMNEEYFKIAEARINNYELYREFLDKKPNLKKH